jgi:hypothetical protein
MGVAAGKAVQNFGIEYLNLNFKYWLGVMFWKTQNSKKII